jgi:hypothetical protein
VNARAPALDSVVRVARRLGVLTDDVAFLGGAVVGLLLTDPGAPLPRITRDVDVIVEIGSRREYWALERQLRSRGFVPDEEDGIVCRWVVDGVKVDVMPTDEGILGFASRWYAPAVRTAQGVSVDDVRIRVVTAPHFVATKLEAFQGRGEGDLWASHDVGDIVALADGRPELIAEVEAASRDVREFVAGSMVRLFEETDFEEAISGHLPPDAASQQRASLVVGRLRRLLESAPR